MKLTLKKTFRKPFTKPIVLLGLCLMVVGCTTKFLYNNLDWFVMEYIDDYVTLERDQEEILSQRIELLAQWHKESELPVYIQQLDEIRAVDPSSVSPELVETQLEKIRQHTKRIAEEMTPDLYALTQQLSDEQVNELLRNFSERDAEFNDKYQDLSEEQIRDKYQERIEESFENWFGSLGEQHKRIAYQWSRDMSVTAKDWSLHRDKMRGHIRELLIRRTDVGYFQPRFQSLMNDTDSFYSAELMEKVLNNRQVASKYVALSLNILTKEQHENLLEEIDKWRDIANELLDS
jgi:uncharacterized protein YigA (DUF484 family)